MRDRDRARQQRRAGDRARGRRLRSPCTPTGRSARSRRCCSAASGSSPRTSSPSAPGPEQQVGPTVIVPLTGATNYSADITVPANTLPDNPAPPTSGVYKTVTVLTHSNFGAVTDVVGIVEGPVLRIG